MFPKDYFFAVYCSTAHVDVSSVNLLTGLRVFTGHNLSGLFNVDELKNMINDTISICTVKLATICVQWLVATSKRKENPGCRAISEGIELFKFVFCPLSFFVEICLLDFLCWIFLVGFFLLETNEIEIL